MQAVRYETIGEPDVLTLVDVPKPDPGPAELLVAVRAASINPVDAKLRASAMAPLPSGSGSDFAGDVVAVGRDITEYDVGDRVFGTGLHADRFAQGSFAEFVSVPTDVVAPLPDGVSYEQGAGAALVGVTAWLGLVDRAGIQPGETCFVHGGSGGVGHVAVQLAAAAGATVLATAGSEDALGAVEALGAAHVFEYERPELEADIAAVCEGVDVVLDHRLDDYLPFDVRIANTGGRIVNVGGAHGRLESAPAARAKWVSIHFLSMTKLVTNPELGTVSRILRRLAHLLDHETIVIEIAGRYGLDDVAEVHRAVLEDSYIGKLLVLPGQ